MSEGRDAGCRLVTPEGVVLQFEVATVGDRMAALILDLMVIALGTFALYLAAFFIVFSGEIELAVALALLGGFLLRHFYFIVFELRGSGATYGKRRLNLRVVARDGGPLTADMIFVRNLMRDLEFFLPLIALVAPEALIPQGRGWSFLAGFAWLFVFALMPLFGRHRLRCGDLVAGTLVVREPKAVLLPDVSEKRASRVHKREPEPEPREFVFTPEQLEVYGIRELQVLEDLFRRFETNPAERQVLDEVCERIKRKIRWLPEEGKVDSVRFLRDFYKAQRAHLEQKLLFGKRKERKSGG